MRADVAVVMPVEARQDMERFSARYAGLSEQLGAQGLSHCFVESSTFVPEEHGFRAPFDIENNQLAETVDNPVVIRDLTMSVVQKPLYADQSLVIVSSPETNRFIADRVNVYNALPFLHPRSVVIDETGLEQARDELGGERIVIKSATGMASKDLGVLERDEADPGLAPGKYLAQEFIETSLDSDPMGARDLRIISVAGQAIGAMVRFSPHDSPRMQDSFYGKLVEPDELTEPVQDIISCVHAMLRTLPGHGNNLVSIDVASGFDESGEYRSVLSHVGRKPLRISKWDVRNPAHLSYQAVLEMAARWDKAEAAMLASLVW